MTTICYRDGVMAADSRAYCGDKMPVGSKVKISRLKNGTLIGVSSTEVGAGEMVRKWVEDGMSEDEDLPEAFTLLMAKPDGSVFLAEGSTMLSGPLRADFFAIGSGEQFAYGAMMMGADAIEAAEVGAKADVWSDFPIYAADHKKRDIWEVERIE